MPPSTTLSPTPSFHSMDEYLRPSTTTLCDQDKNVLPPSARECLVDLIQQVEHDNLRQVLKIELNRLLTDHERIVTMLQQRTHMLEQDNEQLRGLNSEHQRRYEKAVREMQFFKKKADYLSKQQQSPSIAHSSSNTSNSTASRTRSHSSASETRSEISAISSSAPLPPPHAAPPLPPPPPPQQQPLPPTPASTSTSAINYPLTPTSPQPSVVSEREEYDSLRPLPHSSSSMPSRSSSTSSSNAHHYQQSFWNAPPLPSMSSVMSSSTATSSLADNVRQPPNYPVRHAGTNSIYSVGSDVSYPTPQSSTEAAPHPSLPQHPNGQQKRSWQNLRQNPSVHSSYSSPSTTTTATTTTTTTGGGGGGGGGPVSSAATSVYSVPMTPVRSTISTNGYTGSCMIQQRRVDPLMFGGSDGLWDTISKSQGSDATVEKIISNFLRRGGSPNTAKQSPTCHDVKYGYGMIHALIVTKAPGALDLLLQQGANPNALTLSEADENKVTPCYLAARVGWLAGLQKVVQAGGDLINARGEGPKKKTALHTAAEHCHAAVVEFIVGYTQGALNHEVDAQGATALHYACLSGHTDLVGFLVRSCRIPPTQGTNRGEQPIHWAARAGRLEVVALLIERFNCDYNAYVTKRVPSPLDIAKTGGHKRLVDYLKGLGALSSKKLDKKHKNDKSKKATVENALARNGLFADDDDDPI